MRDEGREIHGEENSERKEERERKDERMRDRKGETDQHRQSGLRHGKMFEKIINLIK